MPSSKTNRPSLSEMFKQYDEEQGKLEQEMWGARAPRNSLANSPKFQAILAILQDQPILVEPTLNWLMERRAALAQRQLEVLYTPEQLEAMYAALEK
jgi:hypothetical protein